MGFWLCFSLRKFILDRKKKVFDRLLRSGWDNGLHKSLCGTEGSFSPEKLLISLDWKYRQSALTAYVNISLKSKFL